MLSRAAGASARGTGETTNRSMGYPAHSPIKKIPYAATSSRVGGTSTANTRLSSHAHGCRDKTILSKWT